MFKLQKQNRSSKSGERVDFKLSNFQALQVPKGWDRLFLSMISVETGKTIAKLGKGMVQNGSCLWTETLMESVWLSKDDSSKELEECLFKLVVSMGSSRAGILGEAIINMSSYMSSKMSSPVSLPLRKCNHGTILQVKVQCLTPRPNLRQANPNYSSSPAKDQPIDYQDMDHKPNTSDDSAKVSPSQDLAFTSDQGKYDSEESSYSESGSNHISNPVRGSEKGDHINLMEDLNSNSYIPPQRHIGASPKSSSSQDEYPPDGRSLSNQSPYNSELMNSRMDLQGSRKESVAASSRNTGSQDLLEAAEGPIDELRAEAKMWERNARKLMLDLDMLRNEFLDQSKKQADLVMELSAAYAEHDGLKKEIEQLKLSVEESAVKRRGIEGLTFQSEGLSHIQKELESEIKYQQESNANLALQLRRSQESNVELVSVLQELEETIERQKAEIENLSELQLKYTNTESSIQQTLEDNRCLSHQLLQVQEAQKRLQMNVQLLEKALEEKTNELEKQRLNSQSLLNKEREYKHELLDKDDEIAQLEARLQKSVRGGQSEDVGLNDRTNTDLIREIESLREKVQELERDCNELTDENLELLLKLKESKNVNIEKCGSFSSISSEFPTKSASAHSEVSDIDPQIYDTELKKQVKEEQWIADETSEVFLGLLKQAEVAFHHLMKPASSKCSVVSKQYEYLHDDLVNLAKKDAPNSKVWAESIVKYFFELNKLLEDRINECKLMFKHDELEIQYKNAITDESENSLKYHILKIQEHESAKAQIDADQANLLMELSQKRSEIEKLKFDLLRKEEKTNNLFQYQMEFEVPIADLEMRKDQLEENNRTVQRESNITSKCMDDMRNDLALLSNSLDLHVSANKILEKKTSELETEKLRLESKIAGLEQENLQLQECISVLDVQWRQFKEESEFFQLELRNSQSAVTNLQVQIRSLEIEMETKKSKIKQEFHDTRDQLLEAQRDCERLRRENQELHASALRLGEERKILQQLNKELKKKELELHEHCVQLEAQLEESERSFSCCSKKIEALEENLASLLETFSLKEKSLHSELDSLLQENRIEKEKLTRQEILWNQIHLEMSAELDNLQKEVENLTRLVSEVREEKKNVESEACSKISSLHADKTKLESTLQEVYLKVESSERELTTTREESQLEFQRLKSELATSEQNQVLLRSDHKRLLKQLAGYRNAEEKLKTAVNDLELKLTVSNYENQQLREENANKKFQYQRIGDLQDEVILFKRNAEECRSEKEKLEALLCKISGEYETLKAEKISCFERILSLQEEMSEYENCKKKRLALEEKLPLMEDALLAKEALHAQKIDLESELSEVKMANKQYQQQICCLEEAKAKYLEKARALEVDLKLMGQRCKCGRNDRSTSTAEITHTSKNNEFAEALDMDNARKIGLHSFSSEEQSSERISSKKSMTDCPVVPKERYDRTKSSLETELKDLQERYFHMSLRYAEVEAQREDLVMKLKLAKTGRRWFS